MEYFEFKTMDEAIKHLKNLEVNNLREGKASDIEGITEEVQAEIEKHKELVKQNKISLLSPEEYKDARLWVIKASELLDKERRLKLEREGKDNMLTQVLTFSEATQYLGRSVSYLNNLVATGRLIKDVHYREAGRVKLIKLEVVESIKKGLF